MKAAPLLSGSVVAASGFRDAPQAMSKYLEEIDKARKAILAASK
jgi:hypothetical protein